ncbi:MAG: hypothetical protein ACSHX7_04865 [Luteolibacter sp.]
MKIKSLIALGAVSVFAIGSLHAEDGDTKADKKAAKKAKILEKYDIDKDGKLNAEEKEAMKAEMGEKKGKKGKKKDKEEEEAE